MVGWVSPEAVLIESLHTLKRHTAGESIERSFWMPKRWREWRASPQEEIFPGKIDFPSERGKEEIEEKAMEEARAQEENAVWTDGPRTKSIESREIAVAGSKLDTGRAIRSEMEWGRLLHWQ